MMHFKYFAVVSFILLSSFFCASNSTKVYKVNNKLESRQKIRNQQNGSSQRAVSTRNGEKFPVLRNHADQESIFDQFVKRHPNKLKSVSEKIVGGSNAPRDMARHLAFVLIFIEDQDFPNSCSGVVVGKNRILTTAHCFADEDRSLRRVEAVAILVGLEDLDNDISNDYELLFFAEQVHIEPKYSAFDLKEDIGIITMENDLDDDYPVARIPDKSLAPGEVVWAAGYGRISNSDDEDSIPSYVQEVKLRHRPLQVCKNLEDRRYKPLIHPPSMICASSPVIIRGGKDTCGGDSGGPLYKKNTDGEMFLFGLTSWGDVECGKPDRGSWYTKVRHYKKKIDNHLRRGYNLGKISKRDWTRIF